MKVLKGTINLEGQKLDKIARIIYSTNPQQCLTPSPPTCNIPRLEGILSDLSKKVINLSLLNDTEAIKFSELALCSKREGNSWLMTNSPNERGELVIDFHTSIENI